MRTQPYSDKKFRQLQKEAAPELRRRGMHLVAHRDRPYTTVMAVRNKVRQAPWLPSSPVINGVRMRYEAGRLVPRVAAGG